MINVYKLRTACLYDKDSKLLDEKSHCWSGLTVEVRSFLTEKKKEKQELKNCSSDELWDPIVYISFIRSFICLFVFTLYLCLWRGWDLFKYELNDEIIVQNMFHELDFYKKQYFIHRTKTSDWYSIPTGWQLKYTETVEWSCWICRDGP